MEHKPYFPVFIDLSDKKTVVAGAGEAAREMTLNLLMFTDRITVIAEKPDPSIADLAEEGKISLVRKAYEREDLFDADLVIAAMDDEKEDSDIYAACRCLGIPVYVCGNRAREDFIIPETVRVGSLTVGICDDGRTAENEKAFARRIRGI